MFMNSLIHLLEVTTLILVGVLIIQVSRCYLNFTRMEQAQSKLKESNKSRSLSVRINIASSENKDPVSDVYRKPIAADSEPKSVPVTVLPKKQETSLSDPQPASTSSTRQATSTAQTAPSTHQSTSSIENQNQQEVSQPAASLNGQILNDYIGEFFSEPVQANIEAFRNPVETVTTKLSSAPASQELEEQVSPGVVEKSVSEKDNDEIIVVETHVKKITPVILSDDTLDSESLPILTEMAQASELLGDDSVITVMPENDGGDVSEKVMSDKVVHAMLDEARLVCAS